MGLGFYACVLAIGGLCAAEPWIVRKLSGIEEQAGGDGLSVFRVLARPIAYAFGLLLFLLFDQNNAQFIYSQF